ncbi:MAG: hypothetical protein ACPHER_01215 [Nevskiales bacterium]
MAAIVRGLWGVGYRQKAKIKAGFVLFVGATGLTRGILAPHPAGAYGVQIGSRPPGMVEMQILQEQISACRFVEELRPHTITNKKTR